MVPDGADADVVGVGTYDCRSLGSVPPGCDVGAGGDGVEYGDQWSRVGGVEEGFVGGGVGG